MDLLSRAAPTYEELNQLRPKWHRIDYDRHYPRCGNYHLCERMPAGPEDECFYAVRAGVAGFTKPCFLRRFRRDRLDDALLDALKQRAHLLATGIEQIHDIGATDDGWGHVVSEYVEGLSMAQLLGVLDRQKRTLPWPVALALLCDATRRLEAFFSKGCRHGAVTPARVRLSLRGRVYLCVGVPPPWHPPPATPTQCDADHRALVTAVLPTALGPDERAPVLALLAADDPSALAVLTDHLLERYPVPAEALVAVLRSLSLRSHAFPDEQRSPDRALDDATQQLWGQISDENAGALWRLVLEHSPDMRGGYQPLGDPR